MIAVDINLTIKMTKLQLETTIMHYRNLTEQLFYCEIFLNVFSDIYLNCLIHF